MSINSEKFAKEVRALILKMVFEAKASHVGGALSMSDLLAVLYGKILQIDPQDPTNENRDRFFLSKGHTCTGLYAALGLRGFFPLKDLDTYSKDNSIFLSHSSHKVPGVELSTGSLGHALSVACGVALASKLKGKYFRAYCLVSDGELDEGSNWEAILFAPHHHLDNLTLIVDYNKIQSLGSVKEVLDLHPLNKKFEAFNWNVIEIDGHNHRQIQDSFEKVKLEKSKPSVIIAHTIKGRGVDFMENELLWHYRSPSAEQYQQAIKQIDK